jgi:hypothetical protein
LFKKFASCFKVKLFAALLEIRNTRYAMIAHPVNSGQKTIGANSVDVIFFGSTMMLM